MGLTVVIFEWNSKQKELTEKQIQFCFFFKVYSLLILSAFDSQTNISKLEIWLNYNFITTLTHEGTIIKTLETCSNSS